LVLVELVEQLLVAEKRMVQQEKILSLPQLQPKGVGLDTEAEKRMHPTHLV
jgi:hypothetical protein